MPRAKIGDAYAVKVPNGYKIIQWAYHIERYGSFIRVFDGLYDTIPGNIAQIVAGEHSYVTDLFVGRAYRIGLLEWLGNFPVPEEYPFPEYHIEFCAKKTEVFGLRITQRKGSDSFLHFSDTPITTIAVLPEQYQNIKRLAHCVSPDWLLYLFDNDFTLHKADVFYPWIHWGENWEDKYQVYVDMVNTAWDADKAKRAKNKAKE